MLGTAGCLIAGIVCLFARNHSEFVLLDVPRRRLFKVIEDGAGRREQSMPFAEIVDVEIEREAVRESDGYSTIDKLVFTLVARGRGGQSMVVADPDETTDIAVRNSPKLSALRDRLKDLTERAG
ncbi:MAG: hypothetical protein ACKVP7_25155 [Hyphomicrobiaceae bacterium]